MPIKQTLRLAWLLAGTAALVTGLIGIVVPLLPTTPLVLLAAWCYSRGCARCERWMLAHPRLGPMVRDWRTDRAVPLRAKQLATVMMTVGSVMAWQTMPRWPWLPALVCAGVAAWLWSLPSRAQSGGNSGKV